MAIVLIFALHEYHKLCFKEKFQLHFLSSLIISLTIYSISFLIFQGIIGDEYKLFIAPLFLLIPIVEIIWGKKDLLKNISYSILGILYLSYPLLLFNYILTPISGAPQFYYPEILIGMFFIIWADDSGAYITGKLFGRKKMIPRISPNKTWEGALGGVLISLLVSIIFFSFFNHFSIFQVILITLATIIAGTFGDLAESLIKRNFGVKDSGKLLPGHGGFLDRFDSMIFAAPVYYLIVSFILN